MLRLSREAANAAAGATGAPVPVLMTEANAESYIGSVDVLLALYAFNHGDKSAEFECNFMLRY